MGISKTYLHPNWANQLAETAKVLAHPARVAILDYIGDCEGCLCRDISQKVGLSQPTTSQHLQVIKESGLLDCYLKGNACYYTINTERLDEVKDVLQGFFESTREKCC